MQNSAIIFYIGVAVRSGRLFSIAKAGKLFVIQSREVVVPERLLYIH